MAIQDESLVSLDLVRDLLINPTAQSMQECQRLLAIVTGAVTARPDDSAFLAEIRGAMQPVRFLLNKAAAFWAARQSATQPSQTYSPQGLLLALPRPANVSVEV